MADNVLSQDEVDALWIAQRLRKFTEKPTPEQVHEWDQTEMGHDAINVSILVRTRADRLGLPVKCATCGGSHAIEHQPRLNLTLWVIHPRKGASRGVEFVDIQESQLPEIYAYLNEAASRNATRFTKLPN